MFLPNKIHYDVYKLYRCLLRCKGGGIAGA
jgi:hypothetical protein